MVFHRMYSCNHAPHQAIGNGASILACSFHLSISIGHQLAPEPLRTTEFAPALLPAQDRAAPASGYAPAEVALPFKQGRFSGRDFVLHPDGTLRCPTGQALSATEHRMEADGSLRLVYAARIRQCRGCPLREPCQWHGKNTQKPRRVSVLLHPLPIGSAPLLWRDWSRRTHRRACMQLLAHQQVQIHLASPGQVQPPTSGSLLSRAERAHYRLSWAERLARNARAPIESPVRIKLYGVPAGFATALGLATA
jgi:hypothetical protein